MIGRTAQEEKHIASPGSTGEHGAAQGYFGSSFSAAELMQ
jgi:hypothetical protein